MNWYQTIAEGFPAQQSPAKDSMYRDLKQVKRWIDALPLANAPAAARMLLDVLKDTNRFVIDGGSRLAILEALRAPLAQLTDVIDRQIVSAGFPIPPARAPLAKLAHDLHKEIALGYRIAAHYLCKPLGKVPFLKGKVVSIALGRAIHHLGVQLTECYLVYLAPPPNIWRTIHACFAFARAIQLEKKSTMDPVLNRSLSPFSAYCQVLLFSACNPYRLTQKEVHDVSLVCAAWLNLIDLEERTANEQDYVIHPEQDAGPGYLPEERQYSVGKVPCFNVKPLEQELERLLGLSLSTQSTLSFKVNRNAAISINSDLVQRLIRSWQPIVDRAYARLPATHHLDMAVGLHAIHYHVAGKVDFETFVRRACGTSVHPSEKDRTTWNHAGELGKPELLKVRVVNQSLGGYRLQWNQHNQPRMKIGEILAIRLADIDLEEGERDWLVGVVRWLRLNSNTMVDAGVELLGRRVRAAVFRPLDAQGHPRPSVRALWVQNIRAQVHAYFDFHIVLPAMSELNAPKYEVRAAPDRFVGLDEPEVFLLNKVKLLENTSMCMKLQPDLASKPVAPASAEDAVAV